MLLCGWSVLEQEAAVQRQFETTSVLHSAKPPVESSDNTGEAGIVYLAGCDRMQHI